MKTEILIKTFDRAYENKQSIALIGKFGIGKSYTVYEFAKKKAKDLGKELVIWHELSDEEKKKIFQDPEQYFILVDIKLQTVSEPSYLVGIPLILQNGKQKIIWELPDFVKVLANEKAYGILFLDEINMSNVSLQSLAFEITLQHKVGSHKLSNNVMVVLAGNDLDSNISANPIPKPLINRVLFVDYEQPTIEEWTKWALEHGIDKRIIAFVNVFNELYKIDENEMTQSTTPRSYELLSNMIKDEEDLDYILFVSETLLHKTTANKFVAFLKRMYLLNYKEFVKNVEEIDKLELQDKYALISIIAQHLDEFKDSELLNVINHLAYTETEISAMFMNFIKSIDMKRFKTILSLLDDETTDRLASMIV